MFLSLTRLGSVHLCANRGILVAQFVEERLGVLQVGRVEALGEPVVDICEHRARSPRLPWFASNRVRLVVVRSSKDWAYRRGAISIAWRNDLLPHPRWVACHHASSPSTIEHSDGVATIRVSFRRARAKSSRKSASVRSRP